MSKPIPCSVACFLLAAGAVVVPAFGQTRGAAELSLNRGINAFMSDDYAAARRHFEAAIALDQQFAAAHYLLGLTLLQASAKAPGEAARNAMLERALDEFNQSRLLDPQLVLAYLDSAVVQSLLGQMDKAESGYQQYLKDRPDDPLPYLFLAVLHYRQAKDDPSHLPKAKEQLDQAEAVLARAEKPDRSLQAHAKLYRALIHLEEKNPQAARQSLEEGYNLAPETSAGRQAKDLLDKVDWGTATARRPWDLTLQMGLDWDTNVSLRGRNLRQVPGEPDPQDLRFGLGSAFTYRVVDAEEVVLGVGTTTFNSWHHQADDFDVQSYGTNVYGAYSPKGAKWLTLGMRYDWDYSFLGRESFLARHRLTPQMDIQWNKWTSTTVFYQFDDSNYYNQSRNDRLDRSGITHALGVIQSFELFEMYKRKFTTSVSYRYEDVRVHGTEFDSDNHVFGLGLSVPLPWDMTFDHIQEFEVDFYRNASLFDRSRSHRQDFIHTMIFALSKQFNEHLSARFQVDVSNDDSNIADSRGQEFFDYNRVIYGLSVMYRF